MGDAVTGINRADSASRKLNGLILRQDHVVCNSSGCRGIFLMPGWQSDCARAVSTSARLTAGTAVVEPGGLPTAARVLRERRRSRGSGSALSTDDSPCASAERKLYVFGRSENVACPWSSSPSILVGQISSDVSCGGRLHDRCVCRFTLSIGPATCAAAFRRAAVIRLSGRCGAVAAMQLLSLGVSN